MKETMEKKLNLKTKIRRMIAMNSITWLGFGFEEITKEFENANDLIAFMSKDNIRPYVIKAVINGSEFLKVR